MAIWPFINARALPDLTSATAAAATDAPSACRIAKPSRSIPLRIGELADARLGPDQDRCDPAPIGGDPERLQDRGIIAAGRGHRDRPSPGIGVAVQAVESFERHRDQSSTRSRISSELARSSGAYIAWARAGRAWNRPGISARRRYETLCLPRASVRAKNATRSSRNSTYAPRSLPL